MKHPEVFLVTAFMLADHFLTLTGAIWKEREYDDHFKALSYELNPMWQEHVAKKRWWNPRHILLTAASTAALLWMAEFAALPEYFIQGLMGALIVVFGAVIGRHVSNLALFTHVTFRPNDISGQVTMTHSFALFISLYQYLAVLVPLALVAVFAPAPFTLGGVIGIVLLLAVHLDWIRKHKRKSSSPVNQVVGEGGRSA